MSKPPNPFNPRIPANPDDFIGRTEELDEFKSALRSTVNRSPMSMAVVGNRGIGKSSFLAKCGQIAKEKDCIVLRFSAIEGSFESIEDICEYILMQIKNEIIKRSKLEILKKKARDFFANFKFKISYEEFGLEIKRSAKRSILQSLFREKLSDIWKNLEGNCQGVVLLIDEAELIEAVPGALMFLREVFSRLGEERDSYMLVLSGKLSFPEHMTEKFSPLSRFFHPVELENLSVEESKKLINKELAGTKIKITEDALEKIASDSEGHPYVLVAIAYVVYENLPTGHKEITIKHYDAVQPKITNYLDVEFFGLMYRRARPVGKSVLKEISRQGGHASFSTLIENLKKPKGSISPVISELIEQGSLIKKGRGEYRVFHRLFQGYLLERAE